MRALSSICKMIKFVGMPKLLITIFWLSAFYMLPNLGQAQVVQEIKDCEDCIWIATDDSLYHWQPDGKSVFNPQGSLVTNYQSLAIAQIADGPNGYIETFIVQNFQSQKYNFWDGQNWQEYPMDSIPYRVVGMGGYGRNIYLNVTKTIGLVHVYHYDGFRLKKILESPNFQGADVAVDSLGRACFPSGEPYKKIDSFTFIDSSGAVVASYPLKDSLGSLNLYGMTFYNDSLYLGLGPTADVHPSSILVFSFKNDSSYLEKVIPQKIGQYMYSDLGSYKPGVPDRYKTPKPEPKPNPVGIAIFPNPTTGVLRITTRISGPIHFELYDSRARKVRDEWLNSGVLIDIADLAKGTYSYRVQAQAKIIKGLLVKI